MSDQLSGSGVVKFYKSTRGWGGIASPDVPADIWVHYSAIDMPGYKELHEGQAVEFRCHAAQQDSWSYVADWVRPLPADAPGLAVPTTTP